MVYSSEKGGRALPVLNRREKIFSTLTRVGSWHKERKIERTNELLWCAWKATGGFCTVVTGRFSTRKHTVT